MRILLLGATGRLGGHLLAEALARGHAVTALARSPERLAAREGLRAVRGDARDMEAIRSLMPGHDAVVSALGAKRSGETYDLIEVAASNLIAAMEASGVRRLLVVASAGILQRDANSLRRDAPGYPAAFRAASAAHLAAYERLQRSGLEWTMLCPPELVEGPAGPYEVREDHLPEGPRRIAMASAAAFALEALEGGRYGRRRVGIADRA